MPADVEAVELPTGSDTLVYTARGGSDPSDLSMACWLFGRPFSATGEDARTWPDAQLYLADFALRRMASGMTGYGRVVDDVLKAFLGLNEVPEEAKTGYSATDNLLAWLQHPAGRHEEPRRWGLSSEPIRYAAPVEVPTPAARLRELSGLDAGRLAKIFGVSRPTYQQWTSGSAPRGARRDHLLQVLSVVEEAAERLGSGSPASIWLLTPVLPAGNRPIDFLRTQRYATFRGFLLRLPIEQRMIRRPAAPRSLRQLSRAELEDALERLSPRAWKEQDASDASEGDSHPEDMSDEGRG